MMEKEALNQGGRKTQIASRLKCVCISKQGALGQRLITDKEPLTSPRGHIRATQVISALRGLEEPHY